jgi:hypothetical protein
MQGFIESLIGEVDAMEKQMVVEDTNLFESYELDEVVVLEEDDDTDIDLDLEEDDDIDDIDLDEDDDVDIDDLVESCSDDED